MSGYYSAAYGRFAFDNADHFQGHPRVPDPSIPHSGYMAPPSQIQSHYPPGPAVLASSPDAFSTYRQRAAHIGQIRPVPAPRHHRPRSPIDEDEEAFEEPSLSHRTMATASRSKSARVHFAMNEDHDMDDCDENVVSDFEEPLRGGKNARNTSRARETHKSKEQENLKREPIRSQHRAGKSIKAPIPSVDFHNPTNAKIECTLKNMMQRKGKEMPSNTRSGRRPYWEIQNYRRMRPGQGAMDPENIELCRLYETHKSFKVVCQIMNDARVAEGKTPSHTPNSLNCRYNRTAPIILMNDNQMFVRVADRKNSKGQAAGHKHTEAEQALVWTLEMDKSLSRLEHEYDQEKWFVVAERMRKKHPDVEVPDFPDANACGYRFRNLVKTRSVASFNYKRIEDKREMDDSNSDSNGANNGDSSERD